MKTTEDIWSFECEAIKRKFPDFFNRVVEWYPLGYGSLGFTMDDDSIMRSLPQRSKCTFYEYLHCAYSPRWYKTYTDLTKRLYFRDYMNEQDWRPRFAMKLCDVMYYSGYVQESLSERTGISYRIINRYCCGLITPSLYNATVICRTMRIPLSEFFMKDTGKIDNKAVKSNYEWDMTLNRINRNYNGLIENMVYWYPIYFDELVVKLDDGTQYLFGCDNMYIYTIYDPRDNGEYINEAEWREEFSYRLRKLMFEENVNQSELADYSKITRQTINNYITGKTTPSLYNATKIAKSLSCTLMNFYIE